MSSVQPIKTNHRDSLKIKLLTYLSLVCIGCFLILENQVNATCSPLASTGVTIKCESTGGDQTTRIGSSSADNVKIIIQAGAVIDVDSYATDAMRFDDDCTVINYGTVISRTQNAIKADESLEITNTGSIIAEGGDGVQVGSNSARNFQLVNSGTITGNMDGVDVNDGTIVNSGTITGDEDGVQIDAASGTVTNELGGEIISNGTASTHFAIDFQYSSRTETGSVINRGTITSTSGGVNFDGTADDSFTNSGTVNMSSKSNTAVNMGSGNDTVTIEAGSSITGIINGGGGTDGLILSANSGDESFDLFSVVNVETLEVKSGATWTLSGSSTFSGGITLNGGTLQGTTTLIGDLTVATGTLAPGNSVGTLTVNGAVSFASGTTLAIEITPSAVDQLVINGGLTITNGSTLNITPAAGQYSGGTTYDLITTTTGITGSFGDPIVASPENFNGKEVSLQVNGNKLQLVVEESPSTSTSSIYSIPTLNEWGMIILFLLLLMTGFAVNTMKKKS